MAFRPLFENEKPRGEYDAIVIAHNGQYKLLSNGENTVSVAKAWLRIFAQFLKVRQ